MWYFIAVDIYVVVPYTNFAIHGERYRHSSLVQNAYAPTPHSVGLWSWDVHLRGHLTPT